MRSPASIHAGGLRYQGALPIISNLVKHGPMRATAYRQPFYLRRLPAVIAENAL